MAERGLVVVTGAAGVVGRIAVPALAERGPVRAVDLTEGEHRAGVRWHVADLRRAGRARRALRGADTVVHLANRHGGKDTWRGALRGDLELHRTVLEAARAEGARRVVLASSLRAYQGYEQAGVRRRVARGDTAGLDPSDLEPLPVDAPPWPVGPYAVGNVMEERLGRQAAGPDLSVVVARLGSVALTDAPTSPRAFTNHLSHGDLARAIQAAVEAPDDPPFAAFVAVSANRWGLWDLEPGRRLGFDPRDDAERSAREPGRRADAATWMQELLDALADRPSRRSASRLDHSLRAAGRARQAGAGDEEVIAALCHDVGVVARSDRHAEVAAAMLRGRIHPRLVWAVRHHEDFMERYHHEHGWRRHRRWFWRWHPWYGTAARLVDRWDAPCDPGDLPAPPLDSFVPLLESTFGVGAGESGALRLARRVVPSRLRRLVNRV